MNDKSNGAAITPRYGQGRDALVGAAVRVVGERGLRKLTYRAVAQEAGVTYGLVHHHFGSLDALIKAALEHSVQASVVAFTTAPGSGDVEALFDGLSEMVEADPSTQAFQYELILEARRRPELLPLVEELYSSYRRALARELAAYTAASDDALVRLIFAALDGLVFQQTALQDAQGTRDALDCLRRILQLVRTSGLR